MNDPEEVSANQQDNFFGKHEEISIRRANPKLLPKVKEKHFDENGKHNDAFDHQVFLGERSAEFDNLTAEEADLRLGLIFEQIDVDNNTMMSEEELTGWIKSVARERVEGRVNEFWVRSNPSRNAVCSFGSTVIKNHLTFPLCYRLNFSFKCPPLTIVSNLVALADGKEEISWEEFEIEQYGFLSESHITVRIAHLRSCHASFF